MFLPSLRQEFQEKGRISIMAKTITNMGNFFEEAKKYEEQIIKDRRYLHQYPELGFDLPNTQKYIRQRLDEMGIENKPCGVVPEEITKNMRRLDLEHRNIVQVS